MKSLIDIHDSKMKWASSTWLFVSLQSVVHGMMSHLGENAGDANNQPNTGNNVFLWSCIQMLRKDSLITFKPENGLTDRLHGKIGLQFALP